jgi:hypothetical protein
MRFRNQLDELSQQGGKPFVKRLQGGVSANWHKSATTASCEIPMARDGAILRRKCALAAA